MSEDNKSSGALVWVFGPPIFNIIAILIIVFYVSKKPGFDDFISVYVLGSASGVTAIGVFMTYLGDKISNKLLNLSAIFLNAFLSILLFAIIYYKFGIIYPDGVAVSKIKFFDSIYFSIVTLTTLGYGDLQPPPGLRVLAAIQAIYGYVLLGLSIALITKSKT